jgi:hypothetical protein
LLVWSVGKIQQRWRGADASFSAARGQFNRSNRSARRRGEIVADRAALGVTKTSIDIVWYVDPTRLFETAAPFRQGLRGGISDAAQAWRKT